MHVSNPNTTVHVRDTSDRFACLKLGKALFSQTFFACLLFVKWFYNLKPFACLLEKWFNFSKPFAYLLAYLIMVLQFKTNAFFSKMV